MEREFEIYWNDLRDEVKQEIASDLNTTPEELERQGNLDSVPIAIIPFENDKYEEVEEYESKNNN